ncbi:hypothetical protein CIG75_11910 [Tumebacillus algifaecis]|uniref:Uncharacterized protein n=1 Tax=Tumebacillus algifaecis TaxID=1214604 RepID=A0A223D2L8_9BACL|nr:hypothetical protein [Tumebacillus algifaecis]ASS75624.1 hypothetical protein CIG75_11910 [Tumebacillus algifaecis]
MSLKAVELQIAVPRTVEHSRLMQNQQHQTTLANAMNSESLAGRTARTEQTVTANEENARTELRDKREGNDRQESEHERSHGEKQQEEAIPHPYKGHRLDIKM